MYNKGAVMNVHSQSEDGPTATFEKIGTVNIANTQGRYAAITLFGEGTQTKPVLDLLKVKDVGTFNVTSTGYGIWATDQVSGGSSGNTWAGRSSINASIEADDINFNTNTIAILSQKLVDSTRRSSARRPSRSRPTNPSVFQARAIRPSSQNRSRAPAIATSFP